MDRQLRSGGVSDALRAPIPRQEFVDAPGGMVRQAGQHVGEPILAQASRYSQRYTPAPTRPPGDQAESVATRMSCSTASVMSFTSPCLLFTISM